MHSGTRRVGVIARCENKNPTKVVLDNSGGNEASNPAGQIETTVTQPVDCPPAPLDLAHSPVPLPKRPSEYSTTDLPRSLTAAIS